MIGGITFEEAKDIGATFNTQSNKVIVGGTYIHNSKSFLADVS